MHELTVLADTVSGCTKCRLSQGRTQVVFGSGHPQADLMFVGEAPGFHEDKQGVPFVGQAGKLLETHSSSSETVHGNGSDVSCAATTQAR